VATFALILMIGGALLGRSRLWTSCLFAAIGGAVGLWLGLAFHAFVLPWSRFAQPLDFSWREVYQNFVRDSFGLQSGFVVLEGIVLGVIVAALIWGITKFAGRRGRLHSLSSAA